MKPCATCKHSKKVWFGGMKCMLPFIVPDKHNPLTGELIELSHEVKGVNCLNRRAPFADCWNGKLWEADDEN